MEETMEETMDEGAKWYGSLRGGLQSSSGSDLEYFDGGSRLGIKGSAEVGEGLIAVYNFEHNISTKDAGLDGGGRLAYAGLAGGFGSITLGQIGAAAFNHTGVITDKSNYFGSSGTNARHGNALSYAFSSGPVGFQLDLISDGDKDTGQGIDTTQFGVSVALGDIGKLGFSHTNMRDTMKVKLSVEGDYKHQAVMGTGEDRKVLGGVKQIKVKVQKDQILTADGTGTKKGELTEAAMNAIRLSSDGTYTTDVTGDACDPAAAATAADSCQEVTVWLLTETKIEGANDGDNASADTNTKSTTTTLTYYRPSNENVVPVEMSRVIDKPGHKNTHIAVEFNIGGVTPYLGHSTKKNNQAIKGVTKTKTTHYGVSGGLGDTGINFLVAARNVKPDAGAKTSPWLFSLSKDLGGGATVIFEHANYDNNEPGNKETAIGLHVNF